jgi:hypothetical protein
MAKTRREGTNSTKYLIVLRKGPHDHSPDPLVDEIRFYKVGFYYCLGHSNIAYMPYTHTPYFKIIE